MSGIYIQGMKMPKDGELIGIMIHPDGKVNYSFDWKSLRIATAVSVPAHGRLIDAGVIMTKLNETSKRVFGDDSIPECSALSIVADYIETAPTIIPTSEGE